jgi:hypothetical protein
VGSVPTNEVEARLRELARTSSEEEEYYVFDCETQVTLAHARGELQR